MNISAESVLLDKLKQEALNHGDKLEVVSVDCLVKLREELGEFGDREELNRFQRWILKSIYKLSAESWAKSIILVAIPHPAYAKVEFAYQGKKHKLACLVKSDFEGTENYISRFLSPRYRIASASRLPLKRLAVHIGIGEYGRNNITYVAGLGSYFSYAAYFSDMPCSNDVWRDMFVSKSCADCRICLNSCPTGAIRDDRFLIDNERCLSYFNESPEPFPDWLPQSAHHCAYECLKCQIYCPMNQEHKDNIVTSYKFSEEETNMLLSGTFESFSPDLKQKCRVLGLDEWFDAIPRNLRILFESRNISL